MTSPRERIASAASAAAAAAAAASASATANTFIRRPTDRSDAGIEFDEESSLLDRGHEHLRRFWQGFIDFAMQGNMLEFAFGLMCVIPPFLSRVCFVSFGGRVVFIYSKNTPEGGT
jgi:hypothetical protein